MSLTDILLGFDDLQPEPETREDYVKAPWSMPGSKFKSLHQILPELPYGKVWLDGCFGTGVVTLNRRPSALEIYNDRYSGITDFLRAVRDPVLYDRLLDRLRTVVYSREEFVWCKKTWENCDDDVERAARWYYMIRCSFNQIGRNFGRQVSGESMLPQKYFRGLKLFPHLHHRLKDGIVENLDVVQLVKDYDSHETVGYLDPDYDGTDRGIYRWSVDHPKLLETIMESKGFYAVSAYRNPLYDSYRWDRIKEWKVATSVRTRSTKSIGDTKLNQSLKQTEVLYLKYW